jgi:hypothetical protein
MLALVPAAPAATIATAATSEVWYCRKSLPVLTVLLDAGAMPLLELIRCRQRRTCRLTRLTARGLQASIMKNVQS